MIVTVYEKLGNTLKCAAKKKDDIKYQQSTEESVWCLLKRARGEKTKTHHENSFIHFVVISLWL